MKQTIEEFKTKLNDDPAGIQFEDTMALIDSHYEFTETAFNNGAQHNAAGENSGSCKLLYFAQLNQLTKQQTLQCFGQYYRDVLNEPAGSAHQNIREFIKHGWSGVSFEHTPLRRNS